MQLLTKRTKLKQIFKVKTLICQMAHLVGGGKAKVSLLMVKLLEVQSKVLVKEAIIAET